METERHVADPAPSPIAGALQSAFEEASKWAYLTGTLEVIAQGLLGRLEHCDRHDPVGIMHERDRLAAISRVVDGHPGWTQEALRAELDRLHKEQLEALHIVRF